MIDLDVILYLFLCIESFATLVTLKVSVLICGMSFQVNTQHLDCFATNLTGSGIMNFPDMSIPGRVIGKLLSTLSVCTSELIFGQYSSWFNGFYGFLMLSFNMQFQIQTQYTQADVGCPQTGLAVQSQAEFRATYQ